MIGVDFSLYRNKHIFCKFADSFMIQTVHSYNVNIAIDFDDNLIASLTND